MTDTSERPDEPDARVPSGVPGLDALLRGGFLRGGTYIITGAPGTGKTILGNQFCFATVAQGGRAIYLTVLGESHARMMMHLRSMRFFHAEEVGRALSYESGSAALKAEGLAGLSKLIFRAVREHGATVLVVDGLVAMEERSEDPLSFREFLHGLCVHNALAGCTTLLLTGQRGDPSDPRYAMVDGVVALAQERVGVKSVRLAEVTKFRGGPQVPGRHGFEISDNGLSIHPRIEALHTRLPTRTPSTDARLTFGIPALDEMLFGGLVRDSSTLVAGPPGSGKTQLGLHFLAEGARRQEPGLYLGFVETPARLVNKAERLGLGLGGPVDAGRVHLVTRVAAETQPDALAEELFGWVKQHGIQRLVLDGLESFCQELTDSERTPRFLAALMHELLNLGVTSLVLQQTRALAAPEADARLDVEALVDNVLVLRMVALRSRHYRVLSVLKARESEHDTAQRLFSMTPRGIEVAADSEGAEALFNGQAPSHAAPPRKPKRKTGSKPVRRGKPSRRGGRGV
ncbi:ATPase domain-containing protein [Myxococcus xanthus]|uniref:non-specific serine/threonine protein kinase n=1 Tax=Myxococcus xanthus TaxID=34 RepID=A0AAE6KVX2_MYXXA|nr:ATPase domain-containing protein [Myxococcus xanthus]QDE71933.1 Circadian clock protein KaiC [Myxococcus xanthus]QDE79215.1 Circadian clock protein KaiC [Myxococcus xanthus]QDF00752.1 Circadian clock protein KaiC [Myxococcus xanthus]QDF08585.1 Circadian clock protein KaiC [Myxococcus xanthus]